MTEIWHMPTGMGPGGPGGPGGPPGGPPQVSVGGWLDGLVCVGVTGWTLLAAFPRGWSWVGGWVGVRVYVCACDRIEPLAARCT